MRSAASFFNDHNAIRVELKADGRVVGQIVPTKKCKAIRCHAGHV